MCLRSCFGLKKQWEHGGNTGVKLLLTPTRWAVPLASGRVLQRRRFGMFTGRVPSRCHSSGWRHSLLLWASCRRLCFSAKPRGEPGRANRVGHSLHPRPRSHDRPGRHLQVGGSPGSCCSLAMIDPRAHMQLDRPLRSWAQRACHRWRVLLRPLSGVLSVHAPKWQILGVARSLRV